MYCKNCGNLLKEEDSFCTKCGMSLSKINKKGVPKVALVGVLISLFMSLLYIFIVIMPQMTEPICIDTGCTNGFGTVILVGIFGLIPLLFTLVPLIVQLCILKPVKSNSLLAKIFLLVIPIGYIFFILVSKGLFLEFNSNKVLYYLLLATFIVNFVCGLYSVIKVKKVD